VENGGCFDENVHEIQKCSNSKKKIEISNESKRYNSENNQIKDSSFRNKEEKIEKFEFLESPKQIINSKQITE